MQYGGSQALRTHADLVTIIVTYLFISAIVTGISFIDFKLFFYIVINQSITIAIKILLLSHFAACSPHRGDPLTVPRLHTSVRQTAATQNSKNKSITSFNCGFPSVPPRRSNQSKLPIKRDMHIHMRLRHHRHRSYRIQRAILPSHPITCCICNSPEPSHYGHFSRQQLGYSDGMARISSDPEPAASKIKDDASSSAPMKEKRGHPNTTSTTRKNITHTQAFEKSHKSSTQTNLLSINKSTMPPATTTTDSTSNSGSTTPPPMRMYGPTMPRPGQPGAMQFIGHNITEFLEE